MAPWKQHLHAAVDELSEQIIALRRHLHAHPELSGEEVETTRHLHQLLTQQGLTARVVHGQRGVIVESGHQAGGRRIAVRADIDALPIDDEKHVPYRSTVPGVMHSCGHDAHAAIVFGALVALDRLEREGQLPHPVTWRGVFQPAEETATGANEMIAAGAVAEVDGILSVHVDPTRHVGQVALRSGVMTAHCDAIAIELHGHGGHAARPHLTRDPVAAAAQLISLLYQQVPRSIDSQEAVVLTIGEIHGGRCANVIPERVTLQGTLRTLDDEVRSEALRHIARICTAVGEATSTRIHVELGVHIPAVDNDHALAQQLAQAGVELLGPDGVERIRRPSMGGEDFAFYQKHLPGALFRLGCARDSSPGAGLHTPLFDIDEQCLAIGAKLLATATVLASQGEGDSGDEERG